MSNKNLDNIKVNKIEGEKKNAMLKKSLIAVGIILMFTPAVICGGWVFFAILTLFSSIAIYEIIKAPGKKFKWWVWGLTYATIYLYSFWGIINNAINLPAGMSFSLDQNYSYYGVNGIIIVISLMGFFLGGVMDKDFSLNDAMYFIAMTLLLGFGFQAFFFIRYFPVTSLKGIDVGAGQLYTGGEFTYVYTTALVWFMVATCALTDTFAYFGGVFLGKHKLNPRISPNKTIEGFVIGYLGGFAMSALFAFMMASNGYPLVPILDMTHWYYILIICLLLPLIGTLGDLGFSFIKRHYGFKDFGTIFPGHGGILDRFDSHIFGAMGLTVLLQIFLMIEGGM